MEKVYQPKEVESKWSKIWQKEGYFAPKLDQKKKPFTIVIPPPNVTGSLHMGHALNNTIQDILIRQKRMEGVPTLWLPGVDHAGIATQVVVEKELAKEGKTRFSLGKENFVEKIWAWYKKHGQVITNQLKRLGCSLDWTRERFTMDKKYEKAVEEAFLHYYKKGWIYQGERLVNWCPRCLTSLSDLELEHKEIKGRLWYIKYPLTKNGSQKATQGYIVVATTRPETVLGDTAVAVNPEDSRYKDLVGKKVSLPLMNREIQIIADRRVDQKFGTGAVKVTPAHDQVDFEIGENHQLEKISVIDEKGEMTKEAGVYAGLDRFKARAKVLEDLENLNLIDKIELYQSSIPHCYRCQTVIEPLISKQWFLKMAALAKGAADAVKEGKVKFIPKEKEKIYFNWLENIRDWCVSRQIWWGHKIPIWYCGDPNMRRMGFAEPIVHQVFDGKTKTYRLRDHGFTVGDKVVFERSATREVFGQGIMKQVTKTTVGELPLDDKAHWSTYKTVEDLIEAFKQHNPETEVHPETPAFIYGYEFIPVEKVSLGCGQIIAYCEEPKRCPVCANTKLTRDPDTLDTWFSSALWPFATLGWPNDSYQHPASPAGGSANSSQPANKDKISDLSYFYPTTVLSTARDIINLWVARMIFSGLEFTGEVPFKEVYIHPTILTLSGKRMSKSLGTGIDPMDLIEKYGADATRFGLMYIMGTSQDIRFTEDAIIAARNFTNKIWNATRFVLMKNGNVSDRPQRANSNHPDDKWILEELDKTVKSVKNDLKNYRFGQASHALYDFFWKAFADIYIEKSKPRRQDSQKTLEEVLEKFLRLLHPFMPYLTEELWQSLPNKTGETIMLSPYPE
ncbi:MAG: valine--tRNA ligase [Candidatus Woykebacteria bacterium RBG_13_40_7b]|uniref:Valine--tRNA ligase n=1 Tax=Candidatus Woykebacteria bacterium RBG_13_40_7b TaxID=1802594 RepID=A0A1G1WBE8_9BACT|nr:MAG: valine--tRNA ligase [Candidatus Woykebacteria bacterium RBG_13_40_7b]